MKRTVIVQFSLAFALLVTSPGEAQLSEQQPGSSDQLVRAEPMSADDSASAEPIEEVIARGRRLSEIEFDLKDYVTDFLRQVAAPVRGRGYARWRRSVCVGVHNLENSAAQYIVDRISALAIEVGLSPGEPGCTPHVNIVFSTDASGIAARMVEADPMAFRPVAGHAGMDLGLEALDEFVATDRVVRWWHISMPVDSRTGNAAIETRTNSCADQDCFPTIAVSGPSRLHSGIQDDLKYVIIVVDGTQLEGTTWEQLSDYLAIVTLAQIDMNTDPRDFDSILNLFNNPAAYSGLTDWDRHFIDALYSINTERNPKLQRGDLAGRIAQRELAFIDEAAEQQRAD